IRRLLEAGARTLPLLAVLFVPVVLGLAQVYPWAQPHFGEDNPNWDFKRAYLSWTGFVVRAAVYFAVWLLLAFLLNRWSREQDRTGAPDLPHRFRVLSGPGLGLLGLTVTFAAIDWVMSLTPDWYSSIFGMIFAMGDVLSGFTVVIVALVLLRERP